MFTLTDGAAAAIKQLVALSEDPHGAGLRVSTGTTVEVTVALDFAVSPEPGDHIFEVRGSRIFLSPSAADLLEGLDVDYEDCAGRPMFCIVVRARVPEGLGVRDSSADSATLDDLEEDLMADDPALAAGMAMLNDLADGPPPPEPGS